MSGELTLKRVYDEVTPSDGRRVLVERLWPRGVSKAAAHLDEWLKAVAPSPELRKWFDHDPERWDEFKARYRTELEGHPDEVRSLIGWWDGGNLTLVYAAADTEHNAALALFDYLTEVRSG